MSNPNDVIRDKILRFLYKVHQNARGPRKVAVGIREIQSGMKAVGIVQKEVNSNLDYLLQKGWVAKVEEKKSFKMPSGITQESVSIKYKISDVGVDRLEGASAFQRVEGFSHINITNINGVTIVGSGNIVNTELTDLSSLLSKIEVGITSSNKVSEVEKLNAIADIGTIQSQLSKPEPRKSIIKEAWQGVEVVATSAGILDLLQKGAELIGSFLSN